MATMTTMITAIHDDDVDDNDSYYDDHRDRHGDDHDDDHQHAGLSSRSPLRFQFCAAWAARAVNGRPLGESVLAVPLRVTALKRHTVRAHRPQNKCDFRECLRTPDLWAVSMKPSTPSVHLWRTKSRRARLIVC